MVSEAANLRTDNIKELGLQHRGKISPDSNMKVISPIIYGSLQLEED